MIMTEKARENRVRRKLLRNDYILAKTPGRSSLREYDGVGFMVKDLNNRTVLGCNDRGYEASLREVEKWASEL